MCKKATFLRDLFLAFSVFVQPANLFAGATVFESGVRQNTMIELFTSEGCNSCPPAEVYLNSFTGNPRLWKDLFPVALHVDYWDYLGWQDRFASPLHSDRQRQYAKERRSPTVYTPAFFLNGRSWRPGWSGSEPGIETREIGVLSLALANGGFRVTFKPVEELAEGYRLQVGIVGFGLRTKIKAGENAGRYAAHDFVLLEQLKITPDGKWNWFGSLPGKVSLNAQRYGLLAWVSSTDSQAPLQVVGGYLSPHLFKH